MKAIGHPEVMRLATQHGLPHTTLMRFTLKLLANLTDPRGGDAMDRIINGLIAPGALGMTSTSPRSKPHPDAPRIAASSRRAARSPGSRSGPSSEGDGREHSRPPHVPGRHRRSASRAFSVVAGALSGPKRYNRAKLDAYECGIEPTPQPVGGGRFPVKYYLTAMLFIVFDIEIVFLYPWAVAFDRSGVFGLVEMVLFIVTLVVAYAYVWRRGGLEWD